MDRIERETFQKIFTEEKENLKKIENISDIQKTRVALTKSVYRLLETRVIYNNWKRMHGIPMKRKIRS